LNVTRLLVISLLIVSIVVGFRSASPMEPALGAVTSYLTITACSTWTTTWYYSGYVTTTSTRYRTTAEITDRLEQIALGGPYVNVSGTWRASSGVVMMDVTITNLMNIDIQSGGLRFRIYGVGTPWQVGSTDVDMAFGAIPPMRSTTLKYQTSIIGVSSQSEIVLTWVAINLYGVKTIVKTIPLETYTYTRTVAETHARIYSETYTTTVTHMFQEYEVGGPLTSLISIFSNPISWVLLTIGGVAVLLVLLFPGKRKAAKPLPKMVPIVAEQRICSGCGSLLEVDEDYCPSCGMKWK